MTMHERSYRIGEAATFVGSTVATLRDWHQRGKLIPAHIPPGGHRFYTERQLREFLGQSLPPDRRKTYLSARVVHHTQQADLAQQVATRRQFAPAAGLAADDVPAVTIVGVNRADAPDAPTTILQQCCQPPVDAPHSCEDC